MNFRFQWSQILCVEEQYEVNFDHGFSLLYVIIKQVEIPLRWYKNTRNFEIKTVPMSTITLKIYPYLGPSLPIADMSIMPFAVSSHTLSMKGRSVKSGPPMLEIPEYFFILDLIRQKKKKKTFASDAQNRQTTTTFYLCFTTFFLMLASSAVALFNLADKKNWKKPSKIRQ